MAPLQSTTASLAPPTVEEVARITAIDSPVLRNLEITYCYARLSAAMAQRTGPLRELVHLRNLGLAPGGPHDPRRGPHRDAQRAATARSSRRSAASSRATCTRCRPAPAPSRRSCGRSSTAYDRVSRPTASATCASILPLRRRRRHPRSGAARRAAAVREPRDRVHYIAHLFRAFHVHEELLGPAFTQAQVQAFQAGTIPDGTL